MMGKKLEKMEKLGIIIIIIFFGGGGGGGVWGEGGWVCPKEHQNTLLSKQMDRACVMYKTRYSNNSQQMYILQTYIKHHASGINMWIKKVLV